MDSKVVVGVGNIYAAEALFGAGIRPTVQACRVTRVGYERLAAQISQIWRAIQVGGTTLRDFVGSDGQPGISGKASMYTVVLVKPAGYARHSSKGWY